MPSPFAVLAATEPGDPAIGNEDALINAPRDPHNSQASQGSASRIVAVLDGVTPLDRTAAPCTHGLRWYVDSVAHKAVDHAWANPGQSLNDSLAHAIAETRALHVDTCDLSDVDAPAATVALARMAAGRFEYLVLADTAIVLDLGDQVQAIVDDRPAQAGRRLRASGIQLPAREFRAEWANRPGGYWVAAADPTVVKEALTGSVAIDDLQRAVIASDGATRLVDTFESYGWPEALDVIEAFGPESWIEQTRAAEADPGSTRRGKRHDDATIVLLTRSRRAEPGAAGQIQSR